VACVLLLRLFLERLPQAVQFFPHVRVTRFYFVGDLVQGFVFLEQEPPQQIEYHDTDQYPDAPEQIRPQPAFLLWCWFGFVLLDGAVVLDEVLQVWVVNLDYALLASLVCHSSPL
jgi:hypothetical protein